MERVIQKYYTSFNLWLECITFCRDVGLGWNSCLDAIYNYSGINFFYAIDPAAVLNGGTNGFFI